MSNTAHESEKAELWPGKPFPGAEPANSSGHYVLGTVPNTVVHGHRRVMSLSKFLKEETGSEQQSEESAGPHIWPVVKPNH